MIVNTVQISEDKKGFISNLNKMSGSEQKAYLNSIKYAAGETFRRDGDFNEDEKDALDDLNHGWADGDLDKD